MDAGFHLRLPSMFAIYRRKLSPGGKRTPIELFLAGLTNWNTTIWNRLSDFKF